jgi:hypothetical protein
MDAAAPSVVGCAETYAAFVALCRARIAELSIPYATVDAICGFPERYTNALLCGQKAMSVWSFFAMARALALLPAFQHDAEQLARLKDRSQWVEARVAGARYRPARRGAPRKRASVLDGPIATEI